MKHTPGPWREAAGTFIRSATDDDDGVLIAVVRDIHVRSAAAKANARLIASAPEMLDALQVARDAIVSALPAQGPIPTNCDQLIDALYTIDTALKAQKGGE